MEAVRYALLQLTHAERVQLPVKLRLAEKDDLQQLVAVRLEVGEKPDLLQGLRRHGVRLIDQHHHAPAFPVPLPPNDIGLLGGAAHVAGLEMPILGAALGRYEGVEAGNDATTSYGVGR